jgi:hypothetical protein
MSFDIMYTVQQTVYTSWSVKYCLVMVDSSCPGIQIIQPRFGMKSVTGSRGFSILTSLSVLCLNVRVESLENWVMKQEEAIKHLKEKLGKSNVEKDQEVIENVNILETKVKGLETNLQRLVSASPNKDKCCKQCDQTFAKNFELEIHMVNFHGLEKQHSCELCGKRFFLKWRLRKHLSVHKWKHLSL